MTGLTVPPQSSPQQCMEHHQDWDWQHPSNPMASYGSLYSTEASHKGCEFHISFTFRLTCSFRESHKVAVTIP